MKKYLCLLLALLLALSACGRGEERETEEGVRLWFAVDNRQADYGHGPALDSQPYQPPESRTGPQEGELDPDPGALLEALLAGPTREGLRSPFPRGVALRQWSWDEERPGVVLVDLSEQYGALTDISLTLADCCIVLTLSQVEGVEAVEITAGGRLAGYRSHQVLSAEEAVLWDGLAREGAQGAKEVKE